MLAPKNVPEPGLSSSGLPPAPGAAAAEGVTCSAGPTEGPHPSSQGLQADTARGRGRPRVTSCLTLCRKKKAGPSWLPGGRYQAGRPGKHTETHPGVCRPRCARGVYLQKFMFYLIVFRPIAQKALEDDSDFATKRPVFPSALRRAPPWGPCPPPSSPGGQGRPLQRGEHLPCVSSPTQGPRAGCSRGPEAGRPGR